MTEAQRIKTVNGYIAKWQPRLGLSEWNIRFSPSGEPGPHKAASGTTHEYLRLYEIAIDKACPPSELEACVVHELLHLVIGPLETKAKAMAGALGDRRTAPLLLDETHDVAETAIEQLVNALIGRRQLTVFGEDSERFAMFRVAA
jgi:hypothetical protein